MFGRNSSIIMGNGKVIIDGKTIEVPNSANITINNGALFINGKKYEDKDLDNKQIIDITIEGNVGKLDCGGSVTVKGNVIGSIDCGGSAEVEGDVVGNIDCGGSCKVYGSHTGDIDAGGSVRTGK
jgi:hypothetical protein